MYSSESSGSESTAVVNWDQKVAQSIRSPEKVGKSSLCRCTALGLDEIKVEVAREEGTSFFLELRDSIRP